MDTKKLISIANELRIEVIKMLAHAGSGHTASALGLAELFSALYFSILNHDPKNPAWLKRDRLILSCGHVVPIRYAAMALSGYFPVEELTTLRKLNSRLQGHPSRVDLPAVETTSGPLGQGSSMAVGMALAARLKKEKHFIYLIMSDAEQDEGQTWEAVMTANKYKLDNLIAFIDQNKIQISGTTDQVMPLESIAAKHASAGWHVQEINGHNIEEIQNAVQVAKLKLRQPSVIILNTIPGKGVDFMENKYEWHGRAPDREEAEKALIQLRV
jgi:transketolase